MALTCEEQCVYEQFFLSAYSSPWVPAGLHGGQGTVQWVISELYGILVLPDGLNQFGKP